MCHIPTLNQASSRVRVRDCAGMRGWVGVPVPVSVSVCVCAWVCVCVWVVQGFFGVFGPRRDIVAFPQPFRETRKQIAAHRLGTRENV